VVAAKVWEQRTQPQGSLLDFLLRSSLRGSGIQIERFRGGMRDVDL